MEVRTPEEALEFLLSIRDSLSAKYWNIANEVLSNSKFRTDPASTGWHQPYPGGLVVHTAEVVDYCWNRVKELPINRDLLITAAIAHDFFKIKEYSPVDSEGHVFKLPFADLIGHISEGAIWIANRAERNNLSTEERDHLVHCLLSHHNKKEWGSPVSPKTAEAIILHEADMASANGPNNGGTK